ncbi:PREDICTED: UDP-glycosyltransferase 71C3-like [Tarenaya hassleriana]|uniref:UDP-glycosyltransferase 71C3-like n=1 Tax=Tarenaya hassleriana TaxID=28532 RepID=UPI00053C23CB|nr:PREDICTED: UDP-glycosyltransferase 71C3-like [Tarenaya hassleriana]
MKKQTELVVVSFPVTGHLLVMIELAKRLINHDHRRRIDTVTILLWKIPFAPHADIFAQSLIASEPRIKLTSLPEIREPPPLELFHKASEAYILESVKKIAPLVRDALSAIVSSSSESVRVVGLLLDFFCVPLVDVGNELDLPSYVFLTCSSGFLSMMKYLPERHRNIPSEFDRSSGDEELPIQGYVSSVPTKVLPPGLFVRESYKAFVELAEKFHYAKGILVNSFSELQPHGFDYFGRLESYPKVYPVGPILSLKDRPNPNQDAAERERIMRWLDGQPESSVVFLCFGSFGIHGGPQLKEIAQALELVGCKFLWSIRTNPTEETSPYGHLPDGFTDRTAAQGIVSGWAPQVEVLAHKAIGGFVSHCGWNSILESLWFGVPIATWPMYAEQQLNAFTMAKELGLAVELRLDYVSSQGEMVAADEIARAVRSLMDGGDGRREKVKEMAEGARKAVMDGGSSFSAITSFIGDLTVVDS